METGYYIGENLGLETLSKEYKKVCLQDLSLFFNEKQILDLISDGIRLNTKIFNDMMYMTIRNYINKYVPKYCGNFSKGKTSGTLFFGVDDTGIVEGFPFYGAIDETLIKRFVRSTISNCRGVRCIDEEYVYDQDVVEWYYDNMEIDIYRLEYDGSEQEREAHVTFNKLTRLEHTEKRIGKLWKYYYDKYSDWQAKRKKYGGKLVSYLIDNEMRQDLIAHVKKVFSNDPKLDQDRLSEILEFYSHDSEYYRHLTFTLDYIETIMSDFYSPIRWLVIYKDGILTELKKIKPMHPMERPETELHLRFCCDVQFFRTFLFQRQPQELNFYVIKITFPNLTGAYTEYRYTEMSDWISRARISLDKGPSCL